ncbi:sporulation histidine kinase inhibitor Sda [Paenibacillus nasutitermitis]|uniref:Uncharacterized protein n=1 Tax=Paenibacillus nasutitermitis TaxID=1652958 RepID=A0A916ZJ71_9BACL|nr:sporulation histidine kinase inhibitor Sda [Paenibacillus nasutitermitis]GGD98968.1 hypothetical protein GCM10010911_67220 [Paenibacillus nasutitermitis]
MKLSNPFASVRNFIRPSEPGYVYNHFTPAFDRSFDQTVTLHENRKSYLPMQDKSLLLRPLSDIHLIEVYHEAKAMRLSEEFISLIEQAIEQRGLSDST